jgi:hypothetical protein
MAASRRHSPEKRSPDIPVQGSPAAKYKNYQTNPPFVSGQNLSINHFRQNRIKLSPKTNPFSSPTTCIMRHPHPVIQKSINPPPLFRPVVPSCAQSNQNIFLFPTPCPAGSSRRSLGERGSAFKRPSFPSFPSVPPSRLPTSDLRPPASDLRPPTSAFKQLIAYQHQKTSANPCRPLRRGIYPPRPPTLNPRTLGFGLWTLDLGP